MEFSESPSPEAQQDINLSCPIARGGPLFIPNLVGPLTRVPNFESSLLQLLQDLQVEVSSGSANACDDDISVDELKVYSEEELVDMAMKAAFKDGEADAGSSSQRPANQPNADGECDHRIPNGELSLIENSSSKGDASNAPECINGFTSEANPNNATEDNVKKRKRRTTNNSTSKDGASTAPNCANGSTSEANTNNATGDNAKQIKRKTRNNSTIKKDASTALVCAAGASTSTKRKRKTRISQALEVSYIAKVEEVVKMKRKQDEDQAAAAAGLHTFNAICMINQGAASSAERADKLTTMRSTGSSVKMKPSIIQEHVPLQYPETVLSVEVYHNTRKFNKTQEFLVLGRQMLTELRDKIHCITDHIMEKAGLYDPSGYFLIEDMFLNDLRDPSAVDYSEPILEWLRTSKEEALRKWECIVSGELQQKQKAVIGNAPNLQLPQFKAVEMQKARLCDLKFQLGAGYVYCHQGDCKHTIVIRDMRLIHPDDIQNRAAYPITTFQVKTRAMKCYVCKIYRATKVTLDDKWAQENPCYFCDNCYFLLHYSKDRSLLYTDFSVFDYHPD